MGDNGFVATGGGKRAGTRRGPKQSRSWRPDVLAYAAGTTLATIGWGLLVWLAIRSGTSARAGSGQHWLWLALASLGAIACLFVAMMLLARISRTLGITSRPAGQDASDSPAQGVSVEPPPAAGAHLHPLSPAPSPGISDPPTSMSDTAERPAIRPPGHRAAR